MVPMHMPMSLVRAMLDAWPDLWALPAGLAFLGLVIGLAVAVGCVVGREPTVREAPPRSARRPPHDGDYRP